MTAQLVWLAAAAAATTAASPIDVLHRMTAAAYECPRGPANEIVVCANGSANQRYRLPLAVPYEAGDPRARSPSRERHALLDFDRGGVGTCSQVGPGGAAGCMQKRWEAASQQAAGSREGRMLFLFPN